MNELKNIRLKKPSLILLIGLAFILSTLLVQFIFTEKNKPENIRKRFFSALHEKEEKISVLMDKLVKSIPSLPDTSGAVFGKTMERLGIDEGLFAFISINDSLIYWSSNSVPFSPGDLGNNDVPKEIVLLRNGWYEIIRKKAPEFMISGLILIQNRYPFQNDFLRNDVHPDFGMPPGTMIDVVSMEVNSPASNPENRIKLTLPENNRLSHSVLLLLFTVYLTGLVLILISIYMIYRSLCGLLRYKWILFSSFLVDVVILRVLVGYFGIPGFFYDSALFSPVLFSSSALLPSLGDLMINSAFGLLISYFFFCEFDCPLTLNNQRSGSKLLVILSFILISLSCFLVFFYLSKELVLNSSIPMTLSDISELNLYSLISFLILASAILSFALIIFTIYGWPLTVKNLGLAFVLFSIAGTIFLNHFNDIREKEKRDLLAVRLSMNRDPMAEMLFSLQESDMLSDTVLKASHDNDDSISKYILSRYFGESWNNYLVQVTVCHPGKSLRVQPQNFLTDCHAYFSDLVMGFGKPVSDSHFFYMDYGYGLRNYLLTITLGPHDGKDSLTSVAYIEINSRLLFKDLGYPELLIDKARTSFPDIKGYSYAFYRNGKLIHSFGNEGFRIISDDLPEHTNQHSLAGNSKMFHYRIDGSNVLVISKKTDRFLDRIAPFSYLFFLFSLFSALFFLIVRFRRIIKVSRAGFRERLQLTMTGILISSLLAIGYLSVYYITRLNYEKNRENLGERAHSILVELQHKLGSQNDLLSLDQSYLNELMIKYSNVFFSDVNLYSPDGMLIATSRPEIFENGLISPLMNRIAFVGLRYDHNSIFTRDEMIGLHDYSSAYLPFFNDKNHLLAFINLPYFARQDDLKEEISTFMMAFINIYALLIILGFFTSVLVSNYITRPLRLLTVSLAKLTLGNKNEKLIWQGNDEVGRLVSEYNKKVDELGRSAEILARSERESAWKEMAMQIAHEIKNPLTPMKLSVQYLLRSWDENPGEWDHKLRRFSATMIEQIDSLSFIASEFSDFARMPSPVNEKMDLSEVIRNSVSVYTSLSNITVEFSGADSPAFIFSDRKQILRVFTNLINNSIQAIGEKDQGCIRIVLSPGSDDHVITISDDGPGIPQDQADKIFQPNFTTKSGGMGLGLSIVQKIVITSGGTITFKSEPGKETVFTITLPAFRADKTEI